MENSYLGSMIGPRASCAVSAGDGSGTHVTPFISIEFNVVVDGAGNSGLEMFCVLVVAMFVEGVVLWALSLAHVAHWAARASSMVCPIYFPPCEMQNSVVWPGHWQCKQIASGKRSCDNLG